MEARGKRLHPESLLHIPLVSQMLSDRAIALAPRAVDDGWRSAGDIPISVGGFNPLAGRVFYASRSSFARWLRAPQASARPLNREDSLLYTVLFAVHDYLHAWAYRAISELAPELGFGRVPLDADNFEAFVYCHILSETAATVGLDYWYLSTVDLNEVCPIGTTMTGLTVSYREADLPEYQRFNSRFRVQDRRFFERLHRFYCDGHFRGFNIDDLQQSPLLWRWLEHELRYGETQRRYCRMWFSYLAHGECSLPLSALNAPVRSSARLKRLGAELGELLWEKVKLGKTRRFSRAEPFRWTAPRTARPDFRFLNASRVDVDELVALEQEGFVPGEASFKHWLCQYASRFEHARFDEALAGTLDLLIQTRSFALVRSMFRGQKRIPHGEAELRREPRDLMTLN